MIKKAGNHKNAKNIFLKAIAVLTALVFACGFSAVPMTHTAEKTYAAEYAECDYVEGEVIVGYIDPDSMEMTSQQKEKAEDLQSEAEEIMTVEDVSLADLTIDESAFNDAIQEEGVIDKTVAVLSSDDKNTEELVSDMEKLPNVDYVEPNYIFHTFEDFESSSTDEDLTSEQWGFRSRTFGANVPDWNVSSKKNSDGTVVAVMDTGINYRHEDLEGVMWNDGGDYPELTAMGGGAHGTDTVNGDKYPTDDCGHGTHCAGITAAAWNGKGISGAANGTELMAVKVGDNKGKFPMSCILSGYKYVIKARKLGVNVVAINNSWGGLASSIAGLDDLVNEAGRLGIVSVFASGNEGRNCDSSYTQQDGSQAHYLCYFFRNNPYTITVNAIDEEGALSEYSSGGSNYGAGSTDLAAPGSYILSTLGDDYDRMSGTSMAAPVVSGEVAIVSAAHNDVGADAIASVIKSNTTYLSSLKNKCKSGGTANVRKAVTADPNELLNSQFRLSRTEYSYNGYRPKVNSVGLKYGEDYTVKYERDGACAGTHKVTLTGIGRYHGIVELTYRVKKAIPDVALKYNYFTYDGKTKNTSVTVKGPDKSIWSRGTDYYLSGTRSAKLPGTYKLTVRPEDSDNFYSKTRSFRIAIKPTAVRKLSAVNRGFRITVYKKAGKHVSGYQVRYSRSSNMSGYRTATIGNRNYKVTKTVKKLNGNKKYYVKVRSYKTVNGKRYYSRWSRTISVRTR